MCYSLRRTLDVRYSHCCDRSLVVGCFVRFSVSVSVEFDEVWVAVFLENAFQVSSFIQ